MLHAPARILRAAAICALAATLPGGCSSSGISADPGGGLTPERWDALETREIAAPRDQVMRAAATVMLDEGFVYSMSDHAAGLISGFRLCDPVYSETYARTGGMATTAGVADSAQEAELQARYHHSIACGRSGIVDSTSVWVRASGSSRSLVRFQLRSKGARLADEQRITELSALIERRILADSPSTAPRAMGGSR